MPPPTSGVGKQIQKKERKKKKKEKEKKKNDLKSIFIDQQMAIAGMRGQTRSAESWTVNLLISTKHNLEEFKASGKKTFMPCIAQFPALKTKYHRRPYMLYCPKELLRSCEVGNVYSLAMFRIVNQNRTCKGRISLHSVEMFRFVNQNRTLTQ